MALAEMVDSEPWLKDQTKKGYINDNFCPNCKFYAIYWNSLPHGLSHHHDHQDYPVVSVDIQ